MMLNRLVNVSSAHIQRRLLPVASGNAFAFTPIHYNFSTSKKAQTTKTKAITSVEISREAVERELEDKI